jgi:hypothetical protein
MAKTYRAAVIGSTGRGNYGHGIDTVWREVPGVEVVAVADDNKAAIPAAMKATGANREFRRLSANARPREAGGRRHRSSLARSAPRYGSSLAPSAAFTCIWRNRSARTLAEADAMVAACERSHVKLGCRPSNAL